MEDAHEDDIETFSTIGAATQTVLQRLVNNSKNHECDGERQTPSERTEEKGPDNHSDAVAHGLRQIERFESRYISKHRTRRKRNPNL